jgi:hypothetical protein
MSMQAKWIAAALVYTAAVTTAAEAQRGLGWFQGWRIIGSKVVNGARDSDTIYTPGARHYRQIRVCVFGGPIVLRDLDLYFANGGHQDVATRERLNAGTCTRNIGLNGRWRDLSRVHMKYGQLARGMRSPTVRVTAR